MSLPSGNPEEALSIIDTFQGGILAGESSRQTGKAEPYVAKVVNVYSERNACDVQAFGGGSLVHHVPLMIDSSGLDSSNHIYGEVDLPQVGAVVIIDFLYRNEGMPYITGTIHPYLKSFFQANQVAVNSANKQFTKSLLIANQLLRSAKIYPSGLTIEAQSDGSYIIETPSGTFIRIDETTPQVTIEFRVSGSMKGQILFKPTGPEIDINTATGGKIVLNGNLEVDA